MQYSVVKHSKIRQHSNINPDPEQQHKSSSQGQLYASKVNHPYKDKYTVTEMVMPTLASPQTLK